MASPQPNAAKKPVIIKRDTAPVGEVPSIVLCSPRYAYNVSMTVRLASCYGYKQVWFTGDRVRLEVEKKGKLPREERMKGYKNVEIINYEKPLEAFPANAVPVAVEVRPNSQPLQDFEHPENAVYVFGPEDGSVSQPLLHNCHRFIVIPTPFCLNLATAVATVMWDRALKRHQAGHPIEVARPDLLTGENDPKAIGLYDDIF